MRTAAVIARDILVLASWGITMVVAAATFTTVLEAPYASLGSSPLVNALTTMSLSILAATAVAAATWMALAKAVDRSADEDRSPSANSEAAFANIA